MSNNEGTDNNRNRAKPQETKKNVLECYPYIDAYLSGTLSDTDAERFLQLLEQDKEHRILAELESNAWSDFVLRELASDLLLETEQVSEVPEVTAMETLVETKNEEVVESGGPGHAIPDYIIPSSQSTIDFEFDKPTEIRVITVPSYIPEEQSGWQWVRGLFLPVLRVRREGSGSFFSYSMRQIIRGGLVGLLCCCAWLVYAHFFCGGTKEEPMYFARVTELVDPVWPSPDDVVPRGRPLVQSHLKLQEGLMKIQFRNGAEMILEAPFDLSLQTEKKVHCNQGKISASIPPPATGFEVTTPFGSVIDRGTEFYLEVSDKELELATIKGHVDLGAGDQLLAVTRGMEISFNGILPKSTEHPVKQRYIQKEVFNEKVTEYVSRQSREKSDKDAILDVRSDLLVHFDINKLSHNQVENSAAGGQREVGALRLSSETGEGRWLGTKAIEFVDNRSEAEFKVNETYSSMTLVANVRIDDFGKQGNAILASKEFLKEPGSIYWQVSQTNEIWFYITTGYDQRVAFTSPKVFYQEDCGSWLQLIIVIDSENKRISHYCNGRHYTALPWNDPIPLRLGNVTVGNIHCFNDKKSRHLNGALDELKIFNRALTDKEIRSL